MALSGSNTLADTPGLDSQWTYVRAHLDGLWGNNAGISAQEEARLWHAVATRTLISEWDSVQASSFVSPAIFGGASDTDPTLLINREAIALFTPSPSDWNGTTVAACVANYVSNPGVAPARLYHAVYTGWEPPEFADAGLTGDALAAFQAAKGVFVECGADTCSTGSSKVQFETAIKMAHANNQVFIWFSGTDGTSTWMARMQAEYNQLMSEHLLLPTDVVMVFNYGGTMTPTPETDAQGDAANTLTGMLYWLLQQP